MNDVDAAFIGLPNKKELASMSQLDLYEKLDKSKNNSAEYRYFMIEIKRRELAELANINLRNISIGALIGVFLTIVGGILINALTPTHTSAWSPDTTMHLEKITKNTVSFLGSYENAQKTLKVKSHGWKLIGIDKERNRCKWGFKVVIEFPDHPDYKADEFGGVPIMPIKNIEYSLYDSDGFYLTSLTLERNKSANKLSIAEKEKRTFQLSGWVNIIDAKRAAYGKLHLKAGYSPDHKNIFRKP